MPDLMNDIKNEKDIKLLVDSFYLKVNNDNLLSPVFNNFAKVNWEKHLPIMYDFWSTLLLGTMKYKGQPFPKHLPLPIESGHFDKWIELFVKTIDENFIGAAAEDAKERAMRIAEIFQNKMGLKNRFL